MATNGPGDRSGGGGDPFSTTPRTSSEGGGGQLGRYTLLQRLDVGGMAEVFLARQDGVAGFKKTVVIKRILPQLAVDSRFTEMFLAEANVVAMLHHQNIVQILELGEIDGTYFIALEYVDGMTLHRLAVRSWRNKRPVPMELICSAVADAALGLHHAHTAKGPDGNTLGVVHRDITPDNMMIDREGVTKILDFGIAKPTNDGDRPKTQVGEMKGKLPFVPPEQLIGDTLDARTDIYTLGVGLYWLLTGRRPINGNHDLELMNRIMRDTPVAPSTHNPMIPKALDDLVLQMLEKDRRLRPQTAEEVHDALGFALAARRKVVAPFVNQIMALPRQEEDDRMPASMEGLQASKPATQTFKTLTDTGAIVLPGHSSDMDISFSGEGDPEEPDFLEGGADLIDEGNENATLALGRDELMAVIAASRLKSVPADVILAEAPPVEPTVKSPYETGPTATFTPPTEPTGPVTVPADPGDSAAPLASVTSLPPVNQQPSTPKKPPLWAAAVAAVAVIAVVAAVMMGGGEDPPPPPDPVTDVKPADPVTDPAEVKPVDVKPADPVDVKPADVKPADVKPADVKPADPVVTDPPADVETRPVAFKAPTTVRWWLGGKLLPLSGGKLLVPVTAKTIVAVDDKRGVRTIVPVPQSGDLDYAKLPRGKLLVRANPYADVFLAKDGLGTTPFPALDVVAGTYTVRLVYKGREEKKVIEVKAGAEARVIVDFTKK